MIKNKKQMFIVIAMFALILILGGATYAWFTYRSEGRNHEIVAGDIYLTMTEGNETLTLTNIFPETKEEARARNDNYITFSLDGLNESNKIIYYEIILNHGDDKPSPKSRYTDSDLVFDLIELDNNGNEVKYVVDAESFETLVNRRIWADTIEANTEINVSRKYKLRAWLSEDVVISDSQTNANYSTTEFPNKYATIKLTVNGDFSEKAFGFQKVLRSINNKQNATENQCNPIWTDEADGVVYLSGDNNCIDFNYVWYSGKLWRITSIYPDGTMKLMTENTLTSISWGYNTRREYNGTIVYQWLNEDFYDTLEKPNTFIKKAVWNYTNDINNVPVRPETLENQTTVSASVGLLSAYEYYNAYRNATASTNYLHIPSLWWTITEIASTGAWYVNSSGELKGIAVTSRYYGVRPAIVLKSNVEFTGDGTKTNPYRVVGDKDNPTPSTLLSSRSSGEFVKFDNEIYRIVSVNENNGTTKLTKVDYLKDENNNNVTKNVASSIIYGKSTNDQSDDYWDYYLNHTWYNSISSPYRNMLVDDTYYLGAIYGEAGHRTYKKTICKQGSLDSITTKDCIKYTTEDEDTTFIGKVGLPRVGEMFSSQFYSYPGAMWLITPTLSKVHYLSGSNLQLFAGNNSESNSVRPSITLKAGIKITSGTGYIDSPFEISE